MYVEALFYIMGYSLLLGGWGPKLWCKFLIKLYRAMVCITCLKYASNDFGNCKEAHTFPGKEPAEVGRLNSKPTTVLRKLEAYQVPQKRRSSKQLFLCGCSSCASSRPYVQTASPSVRQFDCPTPNTQSPDTLFVRN